jgi:hypothetical protein
VAPEKSGAVPSVQLPPAKVDEIVMRILTDVCELPDYNSPEDQPELLQCTTGELETIVRRALGQDV